MSKCLCFNCYITAKHGQGEWDNPSYTDWVKQKRDKYETNQ